MSKKKRIPPPKKSNLSLVYAGLALIVIVALAVYFSSAPEPPEKLPTAGKYVKLNKPSTYEPGKVKITEFLKFNCGHCYALNLRIPELEKKYGENLSITYKAMLFYTPTLEVMEQEKPLIEATEAYIMAEKMGKGEEMKNALFKAMFVDRKDITSSMVIEDIARSVGLGSDYIASLKKGDASSDFRQNIKDARDYAVDETPTIIINGNLKVTPALTNEDMDAMAGNIDAIVASLLS